MASVPARVRETELAVVEAPGSSLRTLPVLQASSGEQQASERVGCQEPRLERPSLAARAFWREKHSGVSRASNRQF